VCSSAAASGDENARDEQGAMKTREFRLSRAIRGKHIRVAPCLSRVGPVSGAVAPSRHSGVESRKESSRAGFRSTGVGLGADEFRVQG
jgi:hypothetical protein